MHEVPEELRTRLVEADALRDSGKLEQALAEYTAISDAAPNSAEAFFKLGTAFDRLSGRRDEAERCYRKALSLWREYPEANNNLGLALSGRCKYDQAEDYYRTALAERPEYSSAHQNIGWLLLETGRLDEARYHARRVQALRPDSSAGYDLLGQIARAQGRISEAIKLARSAVEMASPSAAIWTNLGTCLSSCGRHEDADMAFNRALELAPEYFPAWNNLLLSLNFRLHDRNEVLNLHRRYGRIVRTRCGEISPPAVRPDPERRLRVGILSGDLRHHSVAYFLRGPLEFLDRAQFQLYAYYNQRIEDDMMWRLKPLFHGWRSIHGIDDQAAAEAIRTDKIDILIDLAGHTATARPMVLGRRPAALQVHWIGYPNTTGLDCIDYRMTDGYADPESEQGQFSVERLWRMPASFLCYTPPDAAPEPAEPPCLLRGSVTFGSFNVRAKLSSECVSLFCRVLEAVPNSRLVLKSYFGAGDDEARGDLQQLFVAQGIPAERIQVLEKRESTVDHLAAYGEMDIALDTFPYNGTTTTCEALWMGVPVVTLTGDRHAARVGASLLNNAGLGDLVAGSEDEFVAIAAELASDSKRLADFRRALRDHLRASRLFDRPAMGADLGAALRGMWRSYCGSFSEGAPVEGGLREGKAELMRLHIGGKEARDGWKILDAEQRDEVDFVGDIANLDAFGDECCEEIYCSHVLEHVSQAQIVGALGGLHRILAPGGRLYLSVPDLETLAWLFLNPRYDKADRFQVMRRMFGSQRDEHDFHKIGLYFDLLATYLRDVGFSNISHVEKFDLFDDNSGRTMDGHLISLNLVAVK